jgi:outer membrane protein OmpA-like peptidoglycan-associated protein
MKRSTKILLYGLLVSILYIILCIFIGIEYFNIKPKSINKQVLKKQQIESVEKKISSTLDYRIEDGIITIDGNLPILTDNDNLKKSLMRLCTEQNYCQSRIVYLDNIETPPWKSLAKNVIDIFHDENLTNASFYVDKSGNINIDGEFLTKGSKDRLSNILKNYNQGHIKDSSYVKENTVSTVVEEKENTIAVPQSKGISPDSISEEKEDKRDKIDIAQEKITELLKEEKITFYKGGDKITDSGMKTLKKIVDILKDVPNVKIEVKGHTDASGKRSANKKISEKRAESVKRYLGSNGINLDNIEAEGFGEDELLYKDDPNNPLNRRVEIEIKRR